MEPLSTRIDSLQSQLEEAMKTRLAMITRQVREIKAREDDVRVAKKKLDNFERFASAPVPGSALNPSRQQGRLIFLGYDTYYLILTLMYRVTHTAKRLQHPTLPVADGPLL